MAISERSVGSCREGKTKALGTSEVGRSPSTLDVLNFKELKIGGLARFLKCPDARQNSQPSSVGSKPINPLCRLGVPALQDACRPIFPKEPPNLRHCCREPRQ